MTQEDIILILQVAVPLLSGAAFALLGLTKKYTTKMKYACRSELTWVYVLVSAGGSLLFTQLIEAVGTRLVTDRLLNVLILGLIGPGVFLDVIAKFTVSGFSDNSADRHLITLRDYVYEILDTSILRKTTQMVEMQIKKAGEKIDPEVLLREARGILGSIDELAEDKKKLLEDQFGESATRGDYAPIIRELVRHYDVDHIIERLSYSAQSKPIGLQELIQIALDERGQDSEHWEFIVAKVRALQKEPETALHYLKLATEKEPSLRDHIQRSDRDLRIFVGMTRGKSQLEKLEMFKKLVALDGLTLPDVKDKILLARVNDLNPVSGDAQVTLIAAKRNNGDCIVITIKDIETSSDNNNVPIKWQVLEDDKLPGKVYTNIDDLIRYIDTSVIVIQVMPCLPPSLTSMP